MKQVLIRQGDAVIEEVPAPNVEEKCILVKVSNSCISAGTEVAGLKSSSIPLYKRALKQPENVRKVISLAREHGIKRTYGRIKGLLETGTASGYSAAGTVIAVGKNVSGFQVGDRVACAGAGIAFHAEILNVPVNLAIRVPDGVSMVDASTATLGAIAIQGVRRCAPTLGERVLVVGLGIIGQLTVQLLKANGCKVIGVDINPERTGMALANGMDHGIVGPSFADSIFKLSDGLGADAAIVTASTSSDAVISEAMQACRKKARVVLVGDVGLNLNRSDLYSKELDFLISTSYGPGRYDESYEAEGIDYPLPYVRWTENRNMLAYVDLIANGQISVQSLQPSVYPMEEAAEAYKALANERDRPLCAMLEYPEDSAAQLQTIRISKLNAKQGTVKVGLIGAGSFATAMHLPNILQMQDEYFLRAVASRTGVQALSVAKQFSAEYATTDVDEILNDPEIDLVMITTRHNQHGELALRSLAANKHTFVEKPLSIDPQELDAIKDFYRDAGSPPLLVTGFNRRFSPAVSLIREAVQTRTGPMMISYTMNAGYIPIENWVNGAQGGGRNIGEACHIYDIFNYLADVPVAEVTARSINPSSKHWLRNDNFVAVISYVDGSVCTLTYTSLGNIKHPKERMEVFFDGKVALIEDYKHAEVVGSGLKWSARTANKGQKEELVALATCLSGGGKWPISLEHQLSSTEISFQVEREISPGFL